MSLIAVADEAMHGVGFVDPANFQAVPNYPAYVAIQQLLAIEDEETTREEDIEGISLKLADHAHSVRAWINNLDDVQKVAYDSLKIMVPLHNPLRTLCSLVPPKIACVQAKSTTPRIGTTIRSLTHNLALLPPIGEVETLWYPIHPSKTHDPMVRGFEDEFDRDLPLNILLVPYPYRVPIAAFVANERKEIGEVVHPYFSAKQAWLNSDDSAELIAACRELIRIAERDFGPIHMLVFPELALTFQMAQHLVKALILDTQGAQIFTSLDVVIAGCSAKRKFVDDQPHRITDINAVFTYCQHGDQRNSRLQAKHHRWKLTPDQLNRYGLGSVLSPHSEWWEEIDITRRQCLNWVIRPGLVLSTLVCEDLARIEPVQGVMRAIGPSLVIALLMDGPQMSQRWSARYAGSLADDPGSGVLSLTSLGMIRRTWSPTCQRPRQVALWRDHTGKLEEISLPAGAAAVALSLCVKRGREVTLGGRPQAAVLSRKLELAHHKAVFPDAVSRSTIFVELNESDRE